MSQFISTAKRVLWNDVETRRALEEAGLSLTPCRFYNEIPSLADIETGFETTEAEPYAFDFLDRAVVAETLKTLQPFADEFNPPHEDSGSGFFWSNPAFSFSDAMAYYAFVRHHQPKTILEVGSGYSTLAALEALSKNGAGRLASIEPYPMDRIASLDIELHEAFVQSFNAEFFNDTLADGDLLFIDSTHTVKMSSDCAHLYLRVLPNIRRDILVHVHDIRWPLGLSSKAAIERHVYWTEQHLLAAYLLDNPKIRFLLGNTAALVWLRAELDTFMGAKHRSGGRSVWFELNGASA
ncbi:MAG: class I SAM-dependent methyltransferase [Pseudomonadota bacterium]